MVLVASTVAAHADDEIQVYNAEIVGVGKWSMQQHFNYAIQGRREPDFPGGLIPNHTLNGTPEFAYGVTPWFELGFYIPYAIDREGFHSNAGKIRFLFVTPDAAKRDFFYGINFEFAHSMPKFSETRWGMEIRPIIGWRMGDYELIFNPILEAGFGDKESSYSRRPRALPESSVKICNQDRILRRPWTHGSFPADQRAGPQHTPWSISRLSTWK